MTVIQRGTRGAVRVNAEPGVEWGPNEPMLRDEMLSRLKAALADEACWSDIQIAIRLGISDKGVWRYRRRHRIPNCYERRRQLLPTLAEVRAQLRGDRDA